MRSSRSARPASTRCRTTRRRPSRPSSATSRASTGDSRDCDEPEGGAVEASGHACALLSVEAVGVVFDDPIKIECNIGTDPLCDATLPTSPVDLQGLLAGQPLDWTQLIAVLPQILKNLEESLDGAAQDVHIPLIGDTLDAGANVVGTFNDNVVTPFADLVEDLKTSARWTPTRTSTRTTSRC